MKPVMILLLAIATYAHQPAKPKDVEGWGKIKWGMTIAQAKAAYGTGLKTASDHPATTKTSGTDTTVLFIDDLKVGEIPVDASIETFASSDRIARATLSLQDGYSKRGFAYEQLRNLLSQKYGPMTRHENDKASRVTTNSAAWVFPSTVITLQWVEVDSIDFGVLRIVYESTDKKALGVL